VLPQYQRKSFVGPLVILGTRDVEMIGCNLYEMQMWLSASVIMRSVRSAREAQRNILGPIQGPIYTLRFRHTP
jgi:hypothetical protein